MRLGMSLCLVGLLTTIAVGVVAQGPSTKPTQPVLGTRSAQVLNVDGHQLNGLYIQHEAIEVQKLMVNSPNHTTVYIPVGAMGVPLAGTFSVPPAPTTTGNPARRDGYRENDTASAIPPRRE